MYIFTAITELLEKAIASVRQLPESEQNGIALMILKELEKNKLLLGMNSIGLSKKAKLAQELRIYLINTIIIFMAQRSEILILDI